MKRTIRAGDSGVGYDNDNEDHSCDQQWNNYVQHLVIIRVPMMPIQAIISWDNIVIETNQKSRGGKLRGNNITIS